MSKSWEDSTVQRLVEADRKYHQILKALEGGPASKGARDLIEAASAISNVLLVTPYLLSYR